MQIKLTFIVAISIGFQYFTFAQGISQTPYSQYGIGDLEPIGTARNMALGGAGVSLYQTGTINLINPAITAHNRTVVTFEAGFYGQNNKLTTATSSQTIANGNLQYLALLIPVSAKNWTITAGLMPYSNSNTNFITKVPVLGGSSTDTIYTANKLSGGLNQLFISNAIRLPKGFAVGLTTSFVIGGINKKSIGLLVDTSISPQTTSQVESKETYRLLELKPGISYYKKLNSKTNLSVGATMTFSADLGSNRQIVKNVLTRPAGSPYTGSSVYGDTISNDNSRISLPNQYRIGFNMDRNSRWNLAIDYTYTDYSNFKSFDANNVFDAGHRISGGLELIPKYNSNAYLNRVSYRIGAYYNYSPLKLNSTRITESAISWGLGIPMGKNTGGTINVSFMAGTRGTTDNGLIKESFFRFFVGITIFDRWFIRYRED